MDWFRRYPYAYRDTDSSPVYLVAMRNIWRSSGDRSLLEESWPSLAAGWRFSVAHVDRKDGLMVIPSHESGVNENEADRTLKELPLELSWVAGAEAYAELAAAKGEVSISEEARRASELAKTSLTQFWDTGRHYYFEGLRAGNVPFARQTVSPAWGIWQGIFSPREQNMVLDRLAQPAFRTGWGLRSVPSDDPSYEADSYAHGSVSPLSTGIYILAALAAHRPQESWSMWHSLIKASFLGSPGHIPEVLSGDSFRPLEVSVPEQTWSSAALLTSTVRGILGFHPDVPNNKLCFEPHLPEEWKRWAIHGVQFGGRRLEFTLEHAGAGMELSIINDGHPFQLEFSPQVSSEGPIQAYVNGEAWPVWLRYGGHDVDAVMTLTVERNMQVRLSANR